MTVKDLSTLVNGMQKKVTGAMSMEMVAKMMVKLLRRRVVFVAVDLMADLMADLIQCRQHLLLFQIFNQHHQIVGIDQAGMMKMDLSIIVNGMQMKINAKNGEIVVEMMVSLLMRLVALVVAESEM